MRPRHVLKEELAIRKLVTFYYREMSKHFSTKGGERHEFWEFIYIDKGEVEFYTDLGTYHLRQGDILFFMPNLFHGGRSLNKTTCNIIILSFECDSACMSVFEGECRFRLQEDEYQILSLIVFLIRLIRRRRAEQSARSKAALVGEVPTNESFSKIIQFMKSHIEQNYTLDQLCDIFAISRTGLKMIFKEHTGIGAMEYFNRLKVDRAKQLIREENGNISSIAESLGYSSIHHFSKQFKRIADMTPSEYARSILARTRRIGG
ncbi:MAG: transcriptional regulator, AraC family [Paenibacillus sp.]|nr:transcriptional regulator, AraC family [Paenibacillus sp.]